MKDKMFCTLSGMLGAVITFCYGGWNEAMTTLLIFMGIDYVSGICVAMAGKSSKTANGSLSSKVGWKGLMKKGCMMLMLIVACRLDILLDTRWYVKDATCIAFILNELVSIIENYGEFGPVPPVITSIIDVLKGKAGYNKKEEVNQNETENSESSK